MLKLTSRAWARIFPRILLSRINDKAYRQVFYDRDRRLLHYLLQT